MDNKVLDLLEIRDQIDGIDKLLIRGLGNLTGQGSHNLSNEDTIRVQNDFAKWIVEQLRRNLEDE